MYEHLLARDHAALFFMEERLEGGQRRTWEQRHLGRSSGSLALGKLEAASKPPGLIVCSAPGHPEGVARRR
jgi:hypothetical protein